MLSGDNGLLKRVGDARDETIVGQEKEQVELAYIFEAVKNLNGAVTAQNLKDELDSSVGENKTTVTGSRTLKVKFEDTKNVYTVSQNGTVKKYEQAELTDVYVALGSDITNSSNVTLIFSNNEIDIETYLTNNNLLLIEDLGITDISDEMYCYKYLWGLEDFEEYIPFWCSGDIKDNIIKSVFINNIVPKSTACWFYELSNLSIIENINNLKTDRVIDMDCMFWNCSNLYNLDVSNFNTENVIDMKGMFKGCENLTTLDVEGFDVNKVTNMSLMFDSCSKLTTLDVSNFNPNNITNIAQMFSRCSNLTTIDLSSLNTRNVYNMVGMFDDCENLITIIVSNNFVTDSVISYYSSMFRGCRSLIGGNGTVYNSSHIDKTYARIDTASTLGYFTSK